MSYQFRFNNDLNEARERGIGFKLDYIARAYPIPDFIDREVAVDVGCNLGAFPIVNHHRFNTIYAFEAAYECFEQAFLNLKDYEVSNCFLFNLAVHHSDGLFATIKQHENRDNGSNSMIEHPDWNTGLHHKIPTISLDSIYELCNIDRINYLKLDCEGAEYELLMNKDVNSIDFMTVELHNQRPEESKELYDYLIQYFDVYNEHIPFESHPVYQLINKNLQKD